jgi:hypothetical protein
MAPRLETDPKKAAAVLISELGSRRAAAERADQAWNYHHGEDGPDAVQTRFWGTVVGVLVDRTEDPPTADRDQAPRFDANGHVTTTPQVHAGPQRTRSH